RGVVQRLLPAGVDDDLRFPVLDPVVRAIAIADGALEIGGAGVRRVLREVRVDRRVRGGLRDLDGRKIRLAGAEIDHRHARASQPIDDRRDGLGGGSGDALRAFREFRHLVRTWCPALAGLCHGPAKAGHYLIRADTLSRSRVSTSSGTSPWTPPPS